MIFATFFWERITDSIVVAEYCIVGVGVISSFVVESLTESDFFFESKGA